MKENEYITLYPSYWLYNAGLVGIIRTIETAKLGEKESPLKKMKTILKKIKIEEKDYYRFGDNGELYIHKEVWDILPDLYVNMMNWILNKWWFSSIIQKGGIFSGNYIFNAFDSKITKAYEIYDFLIKENKPYLQNICDSDISALTNILTNIQKQDKKNYKIIKEIHSNIILKSIIRTLFMNKNKKNIFNELYTCLKNYKKGDDTGKWESILKYNVSAINIILIDVLRHIFYELKNSNSLEYQCSICDHIHKPWKYEEFNTIWFSKEGGSPNKFENALWYGKTGINMCNRCQWILFFVYIGLNGNIYKNEFINITSAEQLWGLNSYLNELHKKEIEKKESKKKNAQSRLINAITSTGALLKIRSRWMLQNVEFIEMGGVRKDTVYNLDIAPVPLKLLTDYTAGLIPVWLSNVEKIYAPDIYGKIYGISLIKNFLKNETDSMLNRAILIFKYIIKEKKKNEMDKLKSLLLLIRSLIDKQQAEDAFYYFGNRLRYSLKANNKDSDIYIFTHFSKVVTNRKQEFLDEVFRIYMQVSEEIPSKFVSILNMDKTKFKTNALLFLLGLIGGEYNE